MIKTTTTISNKLGLHARASAKLTKLAGSFPCEVWLSKGERRINAKSIMGVMMLAAGIGSAVVLETDGDREQDANDALLALMGQDKKIRDGQMTFILARGIGQTFISRDVAPADLAAFLRGELAL